jgi:hypothetical protein
MNTGETDSAGGWVTDNWRNTGTTILRYSLMRVFTNNPGMDAEELAMIEQLALKDGVVDDRERAILGRMFARVSEQSVPRDVWEEICRFKSEHGIE